ncbi:hypothetical protein HN385_04425 [archaeon]|jgi:hypothetical protein|nr:hypothetical protein [archaeon]
MPIEIELRHLTKKEKREILIMIISVLTVALVGTILSILVPEVNDRSLVGQAITLDPDSPTYEGIMSLLENQCSWVVADGTNNCDSICEENVCLPLEENCDEIMSSGGECRCCSYPE